MPSPDAVGRGRKTKSGETVEAKGTLNTAAVVTATAPVQGRALTSFRILAFSFPLQRGAGEKAFASVRSVATNRPIAGRTVRGNESFKRPV